MTREQRFWAKVDRDSPPCWIWTGGRDRGYGRFWTGDRAVNAHRYAYELLVGPIPDGFHIDHLCRNPACVNPAHLQAVTPATNVLRGTGAPARNARLTACKRGHALTPENLRSVGARGGRHCRICHALRERRRYAAVLAATLSA